MKVTLVCFGGMREYLPPAATGNKLELEVDDSATVGTAVSVLGAPSRAIFSVLVDGHQANLETPLHDDAEIVLMPPFSGGASRPAAVVTVSDGVAAGERDDDSGQLVADILQEAGFEVTERIVVADEASVIEACLRELVRKEVSLVCTTGGTGLGPRDVTPEATKKVVERDAPGLAELMRDAGLTETRHAALSRGVAGATGTSLIINLPGSPRGASTSLRAITSVLDHALELLEGHTEHSHKRAH